MAGVSRVADELLAAEDLGEPCEEPSSEYRVLLWMCTGSGSGGGRKGSYWDLFEAVWGVRFEDAVKNHR